jgi:hypothetical protein
MVFHLSIGFGVLWKPFTVKISPHSLHLLRPKNDTIFLLRFMLIIEEFGIVMHDNNTLENFLHNIYDVVG